MDDCAVLLAPALAARCTSPSRKQHLTRCSTYRASCGECESSLHPAISGCYAVPSSCGRFKRNIRDSVQVARTSGGATLVRVVVFPTPDGRLSAHLPIPPTCAQSSAVGARSRNFDITRIQCERVGVETIRNLPGFHPKSTRRYIPCQRARMSRWPKGFMETHHTHQDSSSYTRNPEFESGGVLPRCTHLVDLSAESRALLYSR